MNQAFSRLPSVDSVLRMPETDTLIAVYGRTAVTNGLREIIDLYRHRIGEAKSGIGMTEAAVLDDTARLLDRRAELHPTPVFNLTGTILHTNLGRAVLPAEAIEAMTRTASRTTALEFDLATGKRGDREGSVAERLRRLTGAQDATFVNNNAAAVLLVLNSLALRKEVPVSRGELIEIGGSFRMPDIMARAGAKLVEVGTTNRTHLSDFVSAIGRRTGAIMKVHPSNYRIEGFTKTVSDADLASLATAHSVPFINDLGSGAMIDLASYGLPAEETPMQALAKGADIVTFSGDKLLGGPQVGLIVGRADLIAKIKRNPLKRALRLDKVTMAALDAVLSLYEKPETLRDRLPTLRLLTRPVDDIEALAGRLLPRIEAVMGPDWRVEPTACRSEIGSGALPGDGVDSAGLAISSSSKTKTVSLTRLAKAFRALPCPVIGRLSGDRLVFDMRCLDDEDGFAAQLSSLRVGE
ncbi:MAG: L-seryl-tRNA(Sec) selenium transferase [Alphaproteobacteria bacterium]